MKILCQLFLSVHNNSPETTNIINKLDKVTLIILANQPTGLVEIRRVWLPLV